MNISIDDVTGLREELDKVSLQTKWLGMVLRGGFTAQALIEEFKFNYGTYYDWQLKTVDCRLTEPMHYVLEVGVFGGEKSYHKLVKEVFASCTFVKSISGAHVTLVIE